MKEFRWCCVHCSQRFRTRALLREHRIAVHKLVSKRGGWSKGLTKETDLRLKKTGETYKQHLKEGRFNAPQLGRPHSEQEKKNLSCKLKSYYAEHPELVPYKLHHSSKESYPEKYFASLFENEGIVGYERDLHVSGYFLDFAFKDKMIDFEVDGSQHYVDKAIVEHDKKRTQVLESLGWKTIRVDWRKWKVLSDVERKQFIEELKTMLK